jgi:glycosyltransferase involved in cell wall biosynthesis
MTPASDTAEVENRPILVCFSHLRWDFVFQRPQHLLSRAAREWRVYYLEEPRFEAGAEAHLESTTTNEGVERLVPVLSEGLDDAGVVAEQRDLVDSFLSLLPEAPSVAWYYTPMALRFTDHLSFPVVVYDCMDELSHFRGAPPELTQLESDLLDRADVVFTGGYSLYESKRQRHSNVHAFPSSVDTAHYLPARDRSVAEPADLAGIAKPRIGYFGVIDERIDLDLIEAVATQRPGWHILMIGPTAKVDPSSLPKQPNIHWLGMKRYAELPRYLAGLDVGWMPFAINDATRFISPTKTPEFLAAGVPVVSTPVHDVVRSWGAERFVAIAGDALSSIAAIEQTLAHGRPDAWLATVDQKLAESSWDTTWSRMRDLIEAKAQAELATMEIAASVG